MQSDRVKDLRKYLEDKENFRESDLILIDQFPMMLKILGWAEEQIQDGKIMVVTAKGEVRKNPAIEVHGLYLNKLREYLAALGTTPKERRKLEAELQSIKDDFDEDEE